MITRKIHLCWRAGRGDRRCLIGVFERLEEDQIRFQYNQKALRSARDLGCRVLPEFPDKDKVYSEDVLNIISRRLPGNEQEQGKSFLQFWKADSPILDDFDRIALTQAWLATDNFEFLAEFDPSPGLEFVTDLAGISHLKPSSSDVKEGMKLSYELETDNEFDSEAVAIRNPLGTKVGYIKKIHCRAFQNYNGIIGIKVKALDKNGAIRRVFVTVSFS